MVTRRKSQRKTGCHKEVCLEEQFRVQIRQSRAAALIPEWGYIIV